MNDQPDPSPPPRRLWPWMLLAAFVVGVVLAAVWVSAEVRRVKRYQQWNSSPAGHAANDPLAGFRDALTGGDPVAGRKIFFEKPEATCGRCHRVAGQGGENGPPLDGIGSRVSRDFLLESMVAPNAEITKGYESIGVALKNGTGVVGTLRHETSTNLLIYTPDDGPVTVAKSDIVRRVPGGSPMPADFATLISQQDLRDLVAFLASLTTNTPAGK